MAALTKKYTLLVPLLLGAVSCSPLQIDCSQIKGIRLFLDSHGILSDGALQIPVHQTGRELTDMLNRSKAVDRLHLIKERLDEGSYWIWIEYSTGRVDMFEVINRFQFIDRSRNQLYDNPEIIQYCRSQFIHDLIERKIKAD